jgi:hypothetical protein
MIDRGACAANGRAMTAMDREDDASEDAGETGMDRRRDVGARAGQGTALNGIRLSVQRRQLLIGAFQSTYDLSARQFDRFLLADIGWCTGLSRRYRSVR